MIFFEYRIKEIDSMMDPRVMADLKEETFVPIIHGTIGQAAVVVAITTAVMTSRISVDVTKTKVSSRHLCKKFIKHFI